LPPYGKRNMTTVKADRKICASLKQDFFRENIMNIRFEIFAGALALGLAGAALAQGDLPPLQTFGGVSFVSGGIGLDESVAIQAAEKDFTLSLLFAQTKRGEYLSDIKVSIKDKGGKTVLETVSEGPMLLAKLPAGVYKVSADYEGKSLEKTVRIDDKGVARAAFVWQPAAKATIE
jgi:hypothetical protein